MKIFTDEAIAKLAVHKADFLKVVPKNQISDPDWVDPDDGSQAPLVDELTDLEHFNKWITDEIKAKIKRGKQLNYYGGYAPVDEDWTV
jgi:hypothetical protein